MPTYYSDEGFPYEGSAPLPETAPLPPNRREEFLASYRALFGQGGGMEPLYSQLELDMGLPRGSMAQMAKIESGGDPNSNRDNDRAYKGLFQLGPAVQKMYGVTDPYDPVQNSFAGAQYAQRHLNLLPSKLGREPEPWEIYMAHQMGLGGITKLANNRGATLSSLGEIGSNALNQNVRGITGSSAAGDFLDVFKDRYNRGWGEWAYKPEGGLGWDPNTFTGSWYDPASHKLMPAAPHEGSALPEQGGFGDFGLTKMGYGGVRAGGYDVAGYDAAGHAFDNYGNLLPDTQFGRNVSDAFAQLAKGGANTGIGLRWNEKTGTYVPNNEGLGTDLSNVNRNSDGTLFDIRDAGATPGLGELDDIYRSVKLNSGDYAGRYQYSGEIRPQDALFLDNVPGGFVTSAGNQVYTSDYLPGILGVGDSQDFAGRYSYSGPLDVQDALWLSQNPGGTIGAQPTLQGPQGNAAGAEYVQTANGGYVPASLLNGFSVSQPIIGGQTPRGVGLPWTAPPTGTPGSSLGYSIPTGLLSGNPSDTGYYYWKQDQPYTTQANQGFSTDMPGGSWQVYGGTSNPTQDVTNMHAIQRNSLAAFQRANEIAAAQNAAATAAIAEQQANQTAGMNNPLINPSSVGSNIGTAGTSFNNVQNPTSEYDKWAALQSTQYNQY